MKHELTIWSARRETSSFFTSFRDEQLGMAIRRWSCKDDYSRWISGHPIPMLPVYCEADGTREWSNGKRIADFDLL